MMAPPPLTPTAFPFFPPENECCGDCYDYDSGKDECCAEVIECLGVQFAGLPRIFRAARGV